MVRKYTKISKIDYENNTARKRRGSKMVGKKKMRMTLAVMLIVVSFILTACGSNQSRFVLS